MIQTIIFDFGGVIATLDGDEAKKRFSDLGVADVDRVLDPIASKASLVIWKKAR